MTKVFECGRCPLKEKPPGTFGPPAATAPGESTASEWMLRPLMGRFMTARVSDDVLTYEAQAETETVSVAAPTVAPDVSCMDNAVTFCAFGLGEDGGASTGTSTRRGSPPSVTTCS